MIVGDTSQCSAVVVEVFGTGGPMGGDLLPYLEKLTAGPAPVALIAMGSPYVLTSFPNVAAFLTTFSTTVPSEISAIKALFGEIPITGHMPVTIPGFAAYGDGIQLAAKTH